VVSNTIGGLMGVNFGDIYLSEYSVEFKWFSTAPFHHELRSCTIKVVHVRDSLLGFAAGNGEDANFSGNNSVS